MESVLEAPTAPQAETPAGETTKGKKAKKAAAVARDEAVLKRLDQSSTSSARTSSGRTPSAPSRDRVREAKAKRQRARDAPQIRARARGAEGRPDQPRRRRVRRSPAVQGSEGRHHPRPTNGQAAPSRTPDAWKSVPLADVWREAGANVALLALLDDGKIKAGPRKGQVAEIRTLGDLAAFTSQPAREADGHQRRRAGEGRRDRDGSRQLLGEAPAAGGKSVRECCTAARSRPASTGSRCPTPSTSPTRGRASSRAKASPPRSSPSR
jgi:hypothetical protein